MKKFLWLMTLLVVTSGLASAIEPESEGSSLKLSRIVGGVKSFSGAWPSTVALLNTLKLAEIESGIALDTKGVLIPAGEANAYAQFCGASLVASNWVLTAAHCIVDKNGNVFSPSRITALVGTTDLLSGGERIYIKQIIKHPQYNNTNIDADLALLELGYHTDVPTISVSGYDAFIGDLATVVGWGALIEDKSVYPYGLYEIDIPIVNRATCDALYKADEFTLNMICAGYVTGGKDACDGDSGGPLMVVQEGQYVQAGITSWGVGCAQPGQYGVYTRLSNFKNWVDFTTEYSQNFSGGGSFFLLLFPFSLLIALRYLVRKAG